MTGGPSTPAASPRDPALITRRDFVAGCAFLAGASALTLAGCGGSSSSVGPTPAPNRWIGVSIAGLRVAEPRWVELDKAGANAPAGAATPAIGTAGGPAAEPAGTPETSLPATRGGSWLVKDAAGSIVAFAPFCPHKRCLYDWEAAENRFHCRCHPGFFAITGAVLGGPPPRPLWSYETRPAASMDVIEIGWYETP
jgi:nitrite reductase/ring-hydroxylating ferredoxin subunit